MYINLNIFSKNLFTFKIKNINIFYNWWSFFRDSKSSNISRKWQ
jgi:hypothetical protein